MLNDTSFAFQMGNQFSQEKTMPGTFATRVTELDGESDDASSNDSSLFTEPDYSALSEVDNQVQPDASITGRLRSKAVGGSLVGLLSNETSMSSVNNIQEVSNQDLPSSINPENYSRTLRGFFKPQPHPCTKPLNTVDVHDLWLIISENKINRTGYPSFAILGALEQLKHGIMSRESLEATPILAELVVLQHDPNNDIKTKAKEVLTRLEKITSSTPIEPAATNLQTNRMKTAAQRQSEGIDKRYPTAQPDTTTTSQQYLQKQREALNHNEKLLVQRRHGQPPAYYFRSPSQSQSSSTQDTIPSASASSSLQSQRSQPGCLLFPYSIIVTPTMPLASSDPMYPSSIMVPGQFDQTNAGSRVTAKVTVSSLSYPAIPKQIDWNLSNSHSSHGLLASSAAKLRPDPLSTTATLGHPSQASAEQIAGRKRLPLKPQLLPSRIEHSATSARPAAHQAELVTRNLAAQTVSMIEIANELVEWVQTSIDLDAPHMGPLKNDLRALPNSFSTLVARISAIVRNMSILQASIHSKEVEIEEIEREELYKWSMIDQDLRRLREKQLPRLMGVRRELLSLELRLIDQKAVANNVVRDFVKMVLSLLKTFSRQSDRSWEQRIGKNLDYISDFEDQIQTLRTSLEKHLTNLSLTKDELTLAQTDLIMSHAALAAQKRQSDSRIQDLNNQLTATFHEVTRQEGIAQAKYREKLNEKLYEVKQEKDTAVQNLKQKYEVQIAEAHAKSLQYGKATMRIDELERQRKATDQEKLDLEMAKSAVEKELGDVEAQSRQWQSYEDAYQQVKEELAQLQVAHNDTLTEIDGMKALLNEAAAAEKHTAHDQHSQLAAQGSLNGNHRLDDEHLRSVADYWRNEVSSKVKSVEKKRAEIARYNDEIANLRRPAQRASALTSSSADNGPLIVNIARMRLLDIGANSLAENRSTRSLN